VLSLLPLEHLYLRDNPIKKMPIAFLPIVREKPINAQWEE